jgi:hypothetical protein
MNVMQKMSVLTCALLVSAFTSMPTAAPQKGAARRVVIISLDGAQPALIKKYLASGVLDPNTGLGRLAAHGVVADQNITVTPSVTAVSHLAIATGSTAAHNDVTGNTIHAVVAPIGATLSGFGAPIGGYQISPLGPTPTPTAEPLWVRLRESGHGVVTATWPGGDGADISVNSTIVQAAQPTRVTDYTVPFGAFGGVGAQGFVLNASNFTDGSSLAGQLDAAGHHSFSPIRVTSAPFETIFCAPNTQSTCGTSSAVRTLRFDMKVAAVDTSNNGAVDYDTLVFFEAAAGIPAGPFAAPATGPAYARVGGPSTPFYYTNSGNKVGTSFFASRIASDLSTVKFVRYGANFIPRNTPVVADVDDVNNTLGFWRAQADFRIPERISPGFGPFSDEELEVVYEDQVATFVDYQSRLAQHAILARPDAELVMVYIEQPDGSGHQFTLTDPRQATDPLNPASIFAGQDPAKVARYAAHLEFAYQQASNAVERIIQTIGVHKQGEPLADIFVVSDHGMAPFHTSVNLAQLLTNAGINTQLLGIRGTGPAVNIYVNLAGRESGGTVSAADYVSLVSRIEVALRNAVDPNGTYNPHADPLFTDVFVRPTNCGLAGFCTSSEIGQDSGDIVALMAEGYNLDGIQSPAVIRLGDAVSATPVYSVPNFYGAHGHTSTLPSMSATFMAAGPDIKPNKKLPLVHNINVAPTILDILGVVPASTTDGRSLREILKNKN